MGTDVLFKKEAKDNHIEIAYLHQRNVIKLCCNTEECARLAEIFMFSISWRCSI